MKYLSLFTGIGGFELGIQKYVDSTNRNTNGKIKKNKKKDDEKRHRLESAQRKNTRAEKRQTGEYNINRNDEREFTCVGYSEIDKYATQIYQKHFPEHKNYGDITKINEKELPDFDFLFGGFPCQSFSIAGKRGGFNDTRGTLFFDICRILKRKKPRLLLLENVKGLLSHESGNTFRTIITTLDELGYDLQWQVLNSKDFGVPQNRERVFIVGHLRGTSRPKVFPLGRYDEIPHQTDESEKTQSQAKPFSTIRTKQAGRSDDNYIKVIGSIEGGGWEKRHEQIRRVHSPKGISPTIPTGTGGGVMIKIEPEHGKIRRLTPLECERLQGFPDNWTQGVSDTQRYKMCGNAVTVNVIKTIMERLFSE